jgi:hypothetical protein
MIRRAKYDRRQGPTWFWRAVRRWHRFGRLLRRMRIAKRGGFDRRAQVAKFPWGE